MLLGSTRCMKMFFSKHLSSQKGCQWFIADSTLWIRAGGSYVNVDGCKGNKQIETTLSKIEFIPSVKLNRAPENTLLGTNISSEKSILKMIFLFPRWDMLISWRVNWCLGDDTFLLEYGPIQGAILVSGRVRSTLHETVKRHALVLYGRDPHGGRLIYHAWS